MRILIWSTAPWVKTGYGKNTGYFIEAFKEEHELLVLATYGLVGGSISLGKNVKVLPSNNNFWLMGDWLRAWEKRVKPDLIIQHFDLWVVQPDFIKNLQTPLVTYMPVDCWPTPHAVKESAKGSADNVAMTKFAQQAFLESDMLSSEYIPHAVNHSIYYPEDKNEAKKALGLPEDSFVIGSVATNKGPRKNIPNQLLAFANFLKKYPSAKKNTFFYLHTYIMADQLNFEGFDLPSIISSLDIENNVYYTDPTTYMIGLDENQMRTLFSSFDLLSECSYGEGFGIPIIEAQACGTPVVGTNFSSIPEVIGEGGSLVRVSEWTSWQKLGVFHAIPSTEEISKIYEDYYCSPKFREEKGKLAIENSKRFSLDVWKTNWNEYLREGAWT